MSDTDRDIALNALRDLATDTTLDDGVRLQAAQSLLHSSEPDFLQGAAEAVLEMEERLAAVEKAVGRRRLERAKVKT